MYLFVLFVIINGFFFFPKINPILRSYSDELVRGGKRVKANIMNKSKVEGPIPNSLYSTGAPDTHNPTDKTVFYVDS